MIIKEFYKTRNDGVNLYRTYSDDNRYVIQNETGISYVEAIDVEDAPYTYTEGDPIEIPEIEEKIMAYDILMGVIE